LQRNIEAVASLIQAITIACSKHECFESLKVENELFHHLMLAMCDVLKDIQKESSYMCAETATQAYEARH
jgi:hypothetical protein